MAISTQGERNRLRDKQLKDSRASYITKINQDIIRKKKEPIRSEQEHFYKRRMELIYRGLNFEEIKEILIREYPELSNKNLQVKIPLEDGSESNAFDIQLRDQIKRVRGKLTEIKATEGNEVDEER